jgi:GNAT superfamily N-acetyltransferase
MAPASVSVVTHREDELPLELREQVLALAQDAWPDLARDERWPRHDPALDPVSVILVEQGRVLSSLDILSKDIAHGGETYHASGISTMVTLREARGQGFGRLLARYALQMMSDDGADLAIFTCDSPLKGFYESAGFSELPGTVLIGGTRQHPFRSDRFDKITVAAFFSNRSRAHLADFRGTDIELYPGDVDKLW